MPDHYDEKEKKNKRGSTSFDNREKFGTEFLDTLGDRINETGFGKFRQKQLNKELQIQQALFENSSELEKSLLFPQQNQIEANILKGISDATQIDERISTPLTYAAIGGAAKGISKIKPKHLGITQTIKPYTPPKGLGKTPRNMVNITNQVDEVFNMPSFKVQDIVRVAKKNKISYKQAEEYLNLKLKGFEPTGTLKPGSSRETLQKRFMKSPKDRFSEGGDVKNKLGENPTDDEIFAEYKRLQDLTEKDFAAYKEFQNPKDPRKIENELKARAIAKGQADPTGYRSITKYGSGTVYENLSTANQKLFKKYGFTDDEAVFVMNNFQSMSRNFEAGIAGGRYSITDFNKATKDMMPAFLDEWANLGITKKKLRPQLDHIAQLAATIPAYANSKLKDFPKITKIFVKYGIFGGHDPRNFQYLPAEIHTLKTNYFNDLIGKDGMKFWSQHDLTTDAGIEKGIREYAALIANSHQIMLDAKKAYKALYKQDIELDEMTDLLYQIINPYQKYTLKEMKFAIREMLRRRIEDVLKSNELLKRSLSSDESINQSMKVLGLGTKKLPKLPSLLSLQQAAIDNIYQPLLTDPTTGKPFKGFLYDIPKRNKKATDKQIENILKEFGFD
tara:strand:+ start:135 stop:1988 length:1854 start_codon:yes stop_codon:yes gene_type:complete